MKNQNGDIRLVCFDLGGVIVRICRSWEEACLRTGLLVRGEAAGERMKAARRAITMGCTVGAVEESEWAKQIVDSLDGLYSVEEIKRIHNAWTMEEYPGWGAVIEELKARGLRTACLSNTVAGHWRRLVNLNESEVEKTVGEKSGGAEYPSILLLDEHYASHLLGVAKPSEAIYRAFERASGYSGEEILFFDDLIENVEGARAVGWCAEQIDHAGSPADEVREYLAGYGLLGKS